MQLCKNCKHEKMGYNLCLHPTIIWINPVDGEIVGRFCSKVRSEQPGIDCSMFEKKMTLWSRIKYWFKEYL